MMKIIGIKELQTNTRKIREEVEKGIHFIVVFRSKPIFEIKPLEKLEFSDAIKATGLIYRRVDKTHGRSKKSFQQRSCENL